VTFIPQIQILKKALWASSGFAIGAALLVSSCSTPSHAVATGQTSAPTAPAVPAVSGVRPAPMTTEDAKFANFIADYRATALASGITAAVYDTATANIHRNDRVMQLNGDQPEFVKQVWTYLDTAVSDRRVSDGMNAMNANLTALNQIEARYGVPKEILVSIWGNESNYGSSMGSFNMFEALATLGYDGPRTGFARPQFLAALQMMQQEHFAASQMTCSWAGAFGHTQLIPSEFLAHAVDGDGDGRRDMWHSVADALASTANIMVGYGWKRGEPAYIEVQLPANFAYEYADGDTQHPTADWKQLGVTRIGGMALPANLPAMGAIYLPAGARGPAFLTFDNFKAILKYNNAQSYALAISYLAKRLGGSGSIMGTWPRDERPLTKDERIEFQIDLQILGYSPGKIDGVLGRGTKAQLRLYQKSRNLPADGFPTVFLLSKLHGEVTAKNN
jgi:membrane-bound lytic murein transglycosylase B